jgi:subtilisin family serine protease
MSLRGLALAVCGATLTLASCVSALGAPGPADDTRVAVGIAEGANARAVSRAIERRTGEQPESLAPVPALLARLPAGASLDGIRGIRYVEPIATRDVAMTPTDPLVSKQWYLTYSGFYQSWVTLPALEPVPVAVIDSGVDAAHPELAGRILDAKSFVGGSARTDTFGHGTFVAGLIAAGVNNGIGIAGLAPSAQLLVAKVVTPSRSIPVDAEAKAIRWAVENGARVINMSLGGIRDPLNPGRDTYSRLESDAVAYAVSNGVVVVAAVGNSDQAPSSPWKYASYPAALPHVLGVSATNDTGGIPKFSNRDAVYNDIAAPGLEILSILPRPLTARFPACADQGYSSCGPEDYREAQGTSFAAPQVTAAAATLLSLEPRLRPEQVTRILQSTARDLTGQTGCDECPAGRDALSGWGRLDVVAAVDALDAPLPQRDSFEANDDAGARAHPLSGDTRRITATLDFWDDQDDVYAIRLKKGQPVYIGLTGPATNFDISLAFWRPGARSIYSSRDLRFRAKVSARSGSRQYLSYRATSAGRHYVQVRMSSPGWARYRLTVIKG